MVVSLFLRTITDNHNFIKKYGIFLKRDLNLGLVADVHFPGGIADTSIVTTPAKSLESSLTATFTNPS